MRHSGVVKNFLVLFSFFGLHKKTFGNSSCHLEVGDRQALDHTTRVDDDPKRRSFRMSDLFDELPEDQQEDSSDLNLHADWFTGPTLWGTDWTTETVISQLKRGNINLNPRYQRRNAWDASRKSLFIESLILGLPIPQIILAEEQSQRGRFIVIDGKQRLLAIRQFAANTEDKEFPQLKLSGLSDRKDLNGVTYDRLTSNPDYSNDLNSFENQTVRTVVIRGWDNEKYLYSVFLRINTGSVQLSPQELRQALHPGGFSDFIDDISIQSEPLKAALKLKQPDFRMRDVELVLRWYAYKNFASEYAGDLKKFLDNATKSFNKDWEEKKDELESQALELDRALIAAREIFGDRGELRKWNGENYERRINRAVFDIMAYYFSDEVIRKAAVDRSADIKAAFEAECVNNREFVSSLETTTKSIQANRTRFSVWAQILNRITGIAVASPIA